MLDAMYFVLYIVWNGVEAWRKLVLLIDMSLRFVPLDYIWGLSNSW
jgi:hypothetical protein